MSDNPRAFPLPHFEQNGKVFYQDGMTLRDWFAGQALALLGGRSWDDTCSDAGLIKIWAHSAYGIADAMLEARKAKP